MNCPARGQRAQGSELGDGEGAAEGDSVGVYVVGTAVGDTVGAAEVGAVEVEVGAVEVELGAVVGALVVLS